MMSVFFIVFGFIADFICQAGNFKSFRRNLLAYCVFALSPMDAYNRRRPPAGVDVGLRDRVGERLAVVDGALAWLEAAPVALAAQVVEGGLGGGDVDRLVRHRAHAQIGRAHV